MQPIISRIQLMPIAGRRQRGFTLVELMIVIAILGILASIAYPTYRQHVLRANRTEGQGLLHDLAMREERFFVQKQRYAFSDDDLKLLGVQSLLSATGKYRLEVAKGTEDDGGYRLSAAPQGVQADDPCGTLSLNALGMREASGTQDNCWR